MEKIVPVFFAVDNAYVPIVHVALQSLMANASKDYTYNIHVLAENMKPEYVKSLQDLKTKQFNIVVNDISGIVGEKSKLMEGKFYGGSATYYRAFIPNLFPQYDKVLYLDADISINADVAELYNTEMGDNYIVGVREIVMSIMPVFSEYSEKFVGVPHDKYFNAGIIVINTKQLRKIKFEETFFDILSKVRLDICPDQDILNYICKGKTVMISDVWNKEPLGGGDVPLKDIKLVHYHFTTKPWLFDGILYEELFWKHAKNSKYYDIVKNLKKTVTKESMEATAKKGEVFAAIAVELNNGPSLEQRIKDINGGNDKKKTAETPAG
jgi:lipopolysaccharide biosynthesis glycosyltransferase